MFLSITKKVLSSSHLSSSSMAFHFCSQQDRFSSSVAPVLHMIYVLFRSSVPTLLIVGREGLVGLVSLFKTFACLLYVSQAANVPC